MSSMTSRRLPRKPGESLDRIRCPVCEKSGDWFAGKYGPFRSRRCQLFDLGKWLGEEHAISELLRPEHLEQSAGDPPGRIAGHRKAR